MILPQKAGSHHEQVLKVTAEVISTPISSRRRQLASQPVSPSYFCHRRGSRARQGGCWQLKVDRKVFQSGQKMVPVSESSATGTACPASALAVQDCAQENVKEAAESYQSGDQTPQILLIGSSSNSNWFGFMLLVFVHQSCLSVQQHETTCIVFANPQHTFCTCFSPSWQRIVSEAFL